jgi:pimeloyl-ACP methyl ester carboxylesterase
MNRAMDVLPLERALTADGAEFHYVTAGHGDPIVFIHGGFGDWTSWAPQWQCFINTHRCFSYSRRFSWPNRNHWREHAVAQDAQDLLALLDIWQLPQAILVGTSYGAYTALMLALQAPERVTAMALTEPPLLGLADQAPGGVQARMDFEAVMAQGAQAYARGDEREAVRILTNTINGGHSQNDTSQAGLEKRLKNAQAMRALCEASEPFPTPDDEALKQLTMPIMLTSGMNSPVIHQCVFRSLSHRLPAAEVRQVANAGHGVHRDQPETFNQLLTDFLLNVGG